MSNGLNKIVTSVNALSENIIIPDTNSVVCIDTQNNRIGIETANPRCGLDVSGTIRSNKLHINTNNDLYNNILYDTSFLVFQNGILINEDISCNGILKIDNITLESLNANNISFTTISGTNLYIDNIHKFNNLSTNDISINSSVIIDGSLNISGNLYVNSTPITSDDRLKHNEININNGLEIIRLLVPQFYQKTSFFKDENFNGILNTDFTYEAGLIAQDIQQINDLSYLVILGNETKPYYLKYNDLFVYGLAAIKELDNTFTKFVLDICNNINNNINNNNNNINNNNISNNNLESIINDQNTIISNLNEKINKLENRILTLENSI